MRLICALVFASLILPFRAAHAADSPCARAAPGAKTVSVACIKARIAILLDVRKVFLEVAGEPLPVNLSRADATVAKSWVVWLEGSAAKLQDLAEMGERSIGEARGGGPVLQTTKQMQETQMSFNMQYLALQTQMQKENSTYLMVSNVLKTRHDTAKNSISNIR
jgi:hypothetical protein